MFKARETFTLLQSIWIPNTNGFCWQGEGRKWGSTVGWAALTACSILYTKLYFHSLRNQLPIYPSVDWLVCLSVVPSVNQSSGLSPCLPPHVSLSVYLHISLCLYLSFSLSRNKPTHQLCVYSACPSICLVSLLSFLLLPAPHLTSRRLFCFFFPMEHS